MGGAAIGAAAGAARGAATGAATGACSAFRSSAGVSVAKAMCFSRSRFHSDARADDSAARRY